MNNIQNPLVSVIVPVHNAGKYLRDCLDSLVYQTLEDIEIIVVESCSADDTSAIAEEYVDRFPEKVFLYTIPSAETSDEGRSFGFKQARAEYVYSCDGDGLVSLNALEALYNKAIEGDYDIVDGRNFTYAGGERSVSELQPDEYLDDFPVDRHIAMQRLAFWSMLIKKTLINMMGDIPTDIPLSDIVYLLPLSSYAKKVAYINKPVLYHYFLRTGSEAYMTFTGDPLDVIAAQRIALRQANPAYKDAVLYHIAKTLILHLTNRWPLMDTIIPWLKELWPELKENPYLLEDHQLFDRLSAYAALPDEPMPCIIYVNGFGQDHAAEEHFRQSVVAPFWNLEKIEELNEQNCDVAEHPIIAQAYEAGNYEFVAQYFAIKRIYETGGVYLNKNIIIDVPFNYTRYWRSFFGFIDDKTYSDWVFGGQKGSNVFAALLKSYDYVYDNDEFFPLSRRISTVLLAEFGMPISGKTNLDNMQVCCTFGPEVVFCRAQRTASGRPNLHLCHHAQYPYPPEVETYTLSAETIETLINNCASGTLDYLALKSKMEKKETKIGTLNERNQVLKTKNQVLKTKDHALREANQVLKIKNQTLREANNALKTESKRLRKNNEDLKRIKKELSKAKKELKNIKSSRLWKLLWKLRHMKKRMKKLFHFFKIR